MAKSEGRFVPPPPPPARRSGCGASTPDTDSTGPTPTHAALPPTPPIAAPAGLPAAQPAKSSAAQPAFQPEDAEETGFLKSFAFRRPDGEPQRLGVKMLRRYVDNVPPKGSKEGQTFQQIKEYCKTAWHDMQTDGIWAEDFWAFDSLEPHELIAINYVGL